MLGIVQINWKNYKKYQEKYLENKFINKKMDRQVKININIHQNESIQSNKRESRKSVTGKRKQHNNSRNKIIILIKPQYELSVTSIASKCNNRQGCNTL